MRIVGLLALPLVVALATPALSQDIKTDETLIDTFQTASVTKNTDDRSIFSAEDDTAKRGVRKFRRGMMLPTGMAF